MTEQETKQMLIDYYVNLLRIKAAEKAENDELDAQLDIVKLKLSSYNMDTTQLEKRFIKE